MIMAYFKKQKNVRTYKKTFKKRESMSLIASFIVTHELPDISYGYIVTMYESTVLTFDSCTKCVCRPGIIYDCTPDYHQVSWV